MSLSDEEKLDFLNKNILLEKVNGKIVIGVIKTDVGRVRGHVDKADSVDWVHGHVFRASSVGLVEERVDWAASVGSVGEESES